MHRPAISLAAKGVWQGHQIRAAVVRFVRIGHGKLVCRVEIVIELEVGLLAVDSPEESVCGESEEVLAAAALRANPSIARCVQTIADLVVVRWRYLAQKLGHKSSRIQRPPVCVPWGTLD